MSSGSGLFLIFVSLKFPPPLLHFFSIPYQAASDRSASHGGFFWKVCICICIWFVFDLDLYLYVVPLFSLPAKLLSVRSARLSDPILTPDHFMEISPRHLQGGTLTWDLYTFSCKAFNENIFIWQKRSQLIDWGSDGLLRYWKRNFCLGVRKYTWYLLYRSQKKKQIHKCTFVWDEVKA